MNSSGDSLSERNHRVQDMEAFLAEDVRDFVVNEGRRPSNKRRYQEKSWTKYFPRRKYLIWSGALLVIFIFVGVGLLELANWPTVPEGDAELASIFQYKIILQDVAVDVKSAMDTSVSPCQDFYQYACGNWLNVTTVPDGRASFSRAVDTIQEKNMALLRGILESQWPLISPFYDNCIDTATINALGKTPINSYINKIKDIQTSSEALMKVVGELHAHSINALFRFWPDPEPIYHNVTVAHFGVGGITLDPEDYSNPNITALYKDHVNQIFAKIQEQSLYSADGVLAIEQELAKAISGPTYESTTFKEVKAKYTHIPWAAYFTTVGITLGDDDAVVVQNPNYFVALNELLNSDLTARWQAYLIYHLVDSLAELLSEDIYAETAQFRAKLTGEPLPPADRWRECVKQTERYLGSALAHHYIVDNFPESSWFTANNVEHDIEQALMKDGLFWMDANTTAVARKKLQVISKTKKFGYPKQWDVYANLWVEPGRHLDTALNARKLTTSVAFKQLGKVVTHSAWQALPEGVDAFLSVDRNELIIPAGIMQPPFFNASYPSFMNYGGIGFEIARELVHAVDQLGRSYDENGAMLDWWSNSSATRFQGVKQCLVEYYSSQTMRLSKGQVKANGELHFNDNFADILGLKRAYAAYNENGDKMGDVHSPFVMQAFDGLNPKQLFFVAFAQGACQKYDDRYVPLLMETQPLSIAPIRVNSAVSQSVEFAMAFNCPAGSPMNPTSRCF